MTVHQRTIVVDGLTTGFLEAGDGEPVVLLHGGEFGADAEVAWEHTIAALATRYRVVAPDQLGYGRTAKVVDFVHGRRMRIRHVARLCDALGIEAAAFVGNSMGAVNLLVDAASPVPLLPARRIVAICGGGEILRNEHVDALYDYDATLPAMRRLVAALFHDPAYAADDGYVARRFASSTAPGAWEAIAAARFRRPGAPAGGGSAEPDYARIRPPTLFVEGGADKLKPPGWAKDLAVRVPHGRGVVVDGAGHCPQIERPGVVNDLLLDFLGEP
ncbi:alpha/beta fold hydrolase [Dactylosporangium sp. AC04546]|uniref:alpha/beta fold hydrolase n=1 Tax=Dactylosporangium sp. AC04546 TaxID=2862460 RepID=UPI001EDF3C91|nr:alpha/beta fold hydrolase [Dactylosporangium sp. AC04546]WVK78475.1 alpha/beta fold hydrolase [Dactylosporangium sp. AC04546]